MSRAMEIQRALENGTLDRTAYEGYLRKLYSGESVEGISRTKAPRIAEGLVGDGVDYVKNTGVLGGKLATTRQIQAAQKELASYGIPMDRRFPGKGGGFAWDVDAPFVSLMKHPTEIQLFHEMTHVRQFQKLGKEGYRKFGKYEREVHVFNKVWKSRRDFKKVEILDAIGYMRILRKKKSIGAID